MRGTHAINSCRHYWEIHVSQRIFGTRYIMHARTLIVLTHIGNYNLITNQNHICSMMFGIGTEDVPLHSEKFENMIGLSKYGWGLSHKGLLWHGEVSYHFTKRFVENQATKIGLFFDGINGTLTYYKDGACLGVAFHDLNKVNKPLYPIIMSTAAKTEMYVSETRRDFPRLKDRCRGEILKHIHQITDIDKLELPISVAAYLKEAYYEGRFLIPVDNCDRDYRV